MRSSQTEKPPSPQAVVAQLRQVIYYNLDMNSNETALFYADILYGLDPKAADSVHLWSLCFYRLGQFRAAHDCSKTIVSKGHHLGCAHIYALSCLHLDKFAEGITALEKVKHLWTGTDNWNKHSDTTRQHLPDAATVHCLLGSLYRRLNDHNSAKSVYSQALKLNPFAWDAFAALSEMGIPLHLDHIFGRPLDVYNKQPAPPVSNSQQYVPSASSGVFTQTSSTRRSPSKQRLRHLPEAQEPGGDVRMEDSAESKLSQRSSQLFGVSSMKKTMGSLASSGIHIGRRARKASQSRPGSSSGLAQDGSQSSLTASDMTASLTSVSTSYSRGWDGGGFSGSFQTEATSPGSVAASMAGSQVSHRAGMTDGSSLELGMLQWLLKRMYNLGAGYYFLHRYECRRALEHFKGIPAPHNETPWVLIQMAKAEYELSNYQAAQDLFARVRRLVPWRVDDLEVYSAVLWLKNEVIALSHLAHELIEFDTLRPQGWIALGNAFSLRKSHDKAIVSFRRATALDPTCAYAYNLQGQEYMKTESFDEAKMAFMRATTVNVRLYHGWYGLGQLHERLGQFLKAESYYRQAAQINPANGVLAVRIGIMLQKQDRPERALKQYARAAAMDTVPGPTYLALYHKALVLLELDRTQEAIAEFEGLLERAPNTPNVMLNLGQAYMDGGYLDKARRCLTKALSLDSRVQPIVKEKLEELDALLTENDPAMQ